jgi:chemotaxis protein CheD
MAGVVTIHIGGVFASREGAAVKTLLGSCIAACLWDPVSQVGGMNHFLLPQPGPGEDDGELSRYGVHAMELLIGRIQRLGGDRRSLQAKLFGGGHVLQMAGTGAGVPEQNIRFIRQFMVSEEIPVLVEDLGGRAARQVIFHTDSGRALVKRLPAAATPPPLAAERTHQQAAGEIVARRGEVTLFES